MGGGRSPRDVPDGCLTRFRSGAGHHRTAADHQELVRRPGGCPGPRGTDRRNPPVCAATRPAAPRALRGGSAGGSAGLAGLPRLAQQAQQGLDRLGPGHRDPPVGQHERQGRQLQPGRLALVLPDRGGVLVARRGPPRPGARPARPPARSAAARAGRPAPCPRRSARRTCARPPPPAAPGRPRPRPRCISRWASKVRAGTAWSTGRSSPSCAAAAAGLAPPRPQPPPRRPRRRRARTSGSGPARRAGARTRGRRVRAVACPGSTRGRSGRSRPPRPAWPPGAAAGCAGAVLMPAVLPQPGRHEPSSPGEEGSWMSGRKPRSRSGATVGDVGGPDRRAGRSALPVRGESHIVPLPA